jgi:hypothetical protein
VRHEEEIDRVPRNHRREGDKKVPREAHSFQLDTPKGRSGFQTFDQSSLLEPLPGG